MTTDPRIAALAAALEYIDVRYQGIFSSASGPGPNDLAAAILAALPDDWCGHAYILDANNADIRDRDQLLRNMRDTIKGHRVCEENMDAEIARLRELNAGLIAVGKNDTEIIARLRAIEEAARKVVDAADPDDDFEASFIEYLVPFELIDALRAALEADHA